MRSGASWRALGFSPQKPERRAIERERGGRVRPGSARPGPGSKARRQERLIVFIDESGISERPTRVRTWAPKGKTPVIQFHFNWTHISVIAGILRTNCLFRLHEGSIKKEQHVEFLEGVARSISGNAC